MIMDEKIVKLQELIDQHDNIVFFGGAGVSTESGIPDFRSQDGLYHQKYDFPPETILSHSFFLNHPEEFYKKRSSHRILIIFTRWQEVRRFWNFMEVFTAIIACAVENLSILHI